MNWLDRIVSWFGLPSKRSEAERLVEQIQTVLERARRHKRSRRYDEALDELEQALVLAQETDNTMLPVAIRLNRADVLIQSGEWDAAEALLNDLEQEAQEAGYEAQLAHVAIERGLLEQARSGLDAASTYFEQAVQLARQAEAAGAEGRAQGHLADVYLADGNASYAAYLLQEALPKLNASGDVEMSSYFVGLLGEAMIQSGREEEGSTLLERAVWLAENLAYRTHEIRWRQALVKQIMREYRYDEARRHLLLILAQQNVYGDPADKVQMLCRMSKVCVRLDDYEAALDYSTQALDVLNNHMPERLRLVSGATHGIALRLNAQNEEALTYLKPIVADYVQLEPEEVEYPYSEVMRNLAAAYRSIEDYAAAESAYQDALAALHVDGNAEKRAEVYRDMGVFYVQQGRQTDALNAWENALQFYEGLDHPGAMARLYCDIAVIRRQQGQLKRAMKTYEQALMLLSSLDDLETRGVVLSNAATAYVDLGDVENAEAFFVESIQIAQQLDDAVAEATRRGNYGWFQLLTGRPKLARRTLDYVCQQSDKLGLALQAAVQTDNLGLAYDELGRFEEALTYHLEAGERLATLNDTYWQGMVTANTGHTLVSLERWTEADSALQSALSIGQENNYGDLTVRSLNGLARIALHNGDLDYAGQLLKEAMKTVEPLGTRRLLIETLQLRGQWYTASGDTEAAAVDENRRSELLASLNLEMVDHTPVWANGS